MVAFAIGWTTIVAWSLFVPTSVAFAPGATHWLPGGGLCTTLSTTTALRLAAPEEPKKKKRRRKAIQPQPTNTQAADPIKVSQEIIEGLEGVAADEEDATTSVKVEDAERFELKVGDTATGSKRANQVDAVEFAVKDIETDRDGEDDLLSIKEVAKFEFKNKDIFRGIQDEEQVVEIDVKSEDSTAIPLPDIKEARKRRELEEEMARIEEEKQKSRPKIKRSDKAAFTRLLEQQPFADADDSYFEEEKYSPVSALLGERAKPFLSIPPGPLSVGHFIGALAIVLMAYIEYPGFPLTNLPSPIRDALQGGLVTVYAINSVLAIIGIFKAKERGQPIPLWMAKTFAIGGLAYDQLTQLPTLEEIEKAQAVKGARAIKKKR